MTDIGQGGASNGQHMRLAGKVAVITGGASGMGAAGARLFAEHGATVVVSDVNAAAAAAVVDEITGRGGTATACPADVGVVDDLKGLFRFVEERYGRLNVLWNHAGIPGGAGLEISVDEFDRTVAVNVRSTFFGTSLALDLLRAAAPSASVICTSSVAGLAGSPASPVYSMTKFGIIGFVRSAAIALAPEGIRLNAICPSPMDTPMFAEFMARGGATVDMDAAMEMARQLIPARRLGRPEDVARAALWLASDESAFVTGTALPVDGGYLA